MFDNLEKIAQDLLISIGEDPGRDGLVNTPKRWAAWWKEFIQYDPGNIDVTFEAIQTDQIVAVSGIRVWSICEHHLLPFFSDIHIGYITGERVVGLSKLARIAHMCAHKLQIQERLTNEIADMVCEVAQSNDVAVIAEGLHLCMVARGIRTPAKMVTSVMRGRFRQNDATRSEFMSLIKDDRTEF